MCDPIHLDIKFETAEKNTVLIVHLGQISERLHIHIHTCSRILEKRPHRCHTNIFPLTVPALIQKDRPRIVWRQHSCFPAACTLN